MRSIVRALARLAAPFTLACAAAAAQGGSLGVSPIRVQLADDTPTAALTLENSGTSAVVVQLQLMRWSAAGEEDRYEPSDEIVAMPPIMTIPPGERQIVRVGLTREADRQRELAYRLYIEEVPPPPKAGYQGLQVALRIGVPIFVRPAAAAAPRLEWKAERGGDGVVVRSANTGNAHQRLMKLVLRAPGDDRVLATRQVVGDLLPGQSRQWSLPLQAPLPGDRLRLSAETASGPTDVEIDVDRP